jgi:hypothetical protein
LGDLVKGTVSYRELYARPFDGEHRDGHFNWILLHPDVEEVYLLGFDLPKEEWVGKPTVRVTFKDGREPLEQAGLSFSSAIVLVFVYHPEFNTAIPQENR